MRVRIFRSIESGDLWVKVEDGHYVLADEWFSIDGGLVLPLDDDEMEFMTSFDSRTEMDLAEDYIYAG